MSDYSELEFHEIADGYPMTQDEEMDALTDSIEQLGQLEDIILYDKKILDGRNRYLACMQLGIEPRVVMFEGTYDEAIALSNARNGARRHLTSGQKAFTAMYAINASFDRGKKLSQKRAASIYSVNYKYIQRAQKIFNESRGLAEAVFRGDITLHKAYEQVIRATSNYVIDEGKFISEVIERLSERESEKFIALTKLQVPTLALKIIELEKGK